MCKHVSDYFSHKTNKNAFKNILNGLVFPCSQSMCRYKTNIKCCSCSESRHCEKVYVLLVCAHCKHFACWSHKHINEHYKINQEHVLSISLETGDIYCAQCKDFIYCQEADEIQLEAKKKYLSLHGLTDWFWRPSFSDLKLMKYVTDISPSPCSITRPTRGLLNMGNTCFMNVVVQALSHTPVLREFLLADIHKCDKFSSSKYCLACEMIRITQEIYRPIPTPYVPSSLLYAIWLHAHHLAGYEQRDAHEFLITLLTLIHTHLLKKDGKRKECWSPTEHSSPSQKRRGQINSNQVDSSDSDQMPKLDPQNFSSSSHDDSNKTISMDDTSSKYFNDESGGSSSNPPATDRVDSQQTCESKYSLAEQNSSNCDCVIHQVFFGNLKSVISYDGCDHQSSTVDPFLDLSLDVVQKGSTSLEACLHSYFKPESIDGLLLCSECNVKRPAVKQFSLLHLPNVLCFYLKRCHSDMKLPTSISFTPELDLAPYLPKGPYSHKGKSSWQHRYSLYAVLNHSGQTDSGHYVAYIRTEAGVWCLCDDHKIFPVTREQVLKTDAYVLLYHKNLLAIRHSNHGSHDNINNINK